MVKCTVCGKEIPEYDAEGTSIGRTTQYRCFKCIADGKSQVESRKARYFNWSYEGKKRVKGSESKK